MKYLKLLTLLLFVFSCSPESVQNLEPTQLEITLKDENNIVLPNAEVKLYSSEQDANNDENLLQTATTDANGKVVFENLQNIVYYIVAGNTCHPLSNFNTNTIVSNSNNPYTFIVNSNYFGTVITKNNSSYEFNITISNINSNYSNSYILPAGEEIIIYNVPSGVINVNGYPTNFPSMVLNSNYNLDCNSSQEIYYY